LARSEPGEKGLLFLEIPPGLEKAKREEHQTLEKEKTAFSLKNPILFVDRGNKT
jgi:hypothetical protein